MGTHGFRFGTVLFLALATTSALAGDCTGLNNCADCTNVPAIINENSNHRCLNGGTCNTGYSGPSDDICNCPDTTEGVDCGITGVTRCNGGSWCGNTGECKAGGGCDCTVGFTDARCERSVPPANCNNPSGHQCQHGGVCTGIANKPCECVSPNGGPSCEKKDVTFCEQGGYTYCENGGSCKVGGGCDCDEGFIGNTCGEIDREWMKQRHGGSSGASKKEVINVAAAVAVPLCLDHRGRLRVHVLHGAKGTKRRAALHEARRLARAAARARFGDERAKRAPGTTRPSSQGVNPSYPHVT